ncbi:ABC transporter permease [Olivibacter ginsenosidimutans]|uniref:ABC transporter permease n=1 Tax=Olivibacter ginsenosidimutans TaxID=1176537 RepID=A0ABP9BA68_9SPHI
MIRNYFRIALRNLKKSLGYSFINILGLASGLACFILILIFVQHELSYDVFHKNADQLYRVIQRRPGSNGVKYWAATSPALAGNITQQFPEVQVATSVFPTFNPLLSLDDKHFAEEGILADDHFFTVFTFPFLQGNSATALKDPNSIVLTASLARKIFGAKKPIGQTLMYQDKYPHIVTGIIADVPETSHLTFSYILPASSDPYYQDCVSKEPWYNNGLYTYVVLAKGVDAKQVEKGMRRYIDKNLADWRPEDRMTFLFQPLKDIHLKSQHLATFAFEKSGNDKYVYLFLAIGFIVLLLACANYTNLAVARSIRRAQEVGIRKVAGAWRWQLIGQFLGESLIMTFLALILAIAMVHFALPSFSQLMERPIRMDYLANPLLLPGLLVLTLLVSLISGSYPALLMSRLKPVQVLKGKQVGLTSRFTLQRILTVGQYAVSITLLVGSFIIYKQMQFVQHQQLGYNREHVLTIKVNDKNVSQQYAAIREELLRNPHVVAMSYSQSLPTTVMTMQSMSRWEGSGDHLLPTNTTSIDYDFLNVYGIQLVAGRGFSRQFGADTLGAPTALINESAVKALGWTSKEAIGKEFDYSDGRGRRTIIGVVKDFHFNSIHQALGPLVLTLNRDPSGYIAAKIRPENLQGTVALFENAIKRVTPYPFEYQFLDDNFNKLYKSDLRLGEMFASFTLLAVFIASLGLFGLAAYSTQQRMKEIGIRKVLGATVPGIVGLLSKDYIKLVFIGFIIAVPLAWYIMNCWLQDFAYRVDIAWWIFALAGIFTLTIALLTVIFQSLKAAWMNPVKTLKAE